MLNQPALFETHAIRRVYDEKTETWLFSVIDIIQVLTHQPDYQGARKYWKVLKGRLAKEGSQLVTSCYQLKMTADDGKQRLTDVATAETLLRLVQSVPSPKAGPIKQEKTGKSVVTGENFLPPADTTPRKSVKKG
jgi:DNA-damage-inducible protein D